MKIKLHYVINDGQDGYASLHLFKTEDERVKYEEECENDDNYVMDNGVRIINIDGYEVVGE